jgi:hypothetical protein
MLKSHESDRPIQPSVCFYGDYRFYSLAMLISSFLKGQSARHLKPLMMAARDGAAGMFAVMRLTVDSESLILESTPYTHRFLSAPLHWP